MSLDFSESIMSMNGSLVHDLNRRDENGEVILSYRVRVSVESFCESRVDTVVSLPLPTDTHCADEEKHC